MPETATVLVQAGTAVSQHREEQGTSELQSGEIWPPLFLLTEDAHVVFALLLVLFNQIVKGVRKILEEHVLLVHLQPQDAVQELGDGAVCKSAAGQGTPRSWAWHPQHALKEPPTKPPVGPSGSSPALRHKRAALGLLLPAAVSCPAAAGERGLHWGLLPTGPSPQSKHPAPAAQQTPRGCAPVQVDRAGCDTPASFSSPLCWAGQV